MAGTRRPATPPDLPGYTYVRHLGSGGYSDVFLYRQEMPRREVAVKVLLDGAVGGDARQRFADEANAMASLSGHPSIVTIHHADVSADGRPYLVMEYYPSDTLRARTLREPLDVATALSFGIQIACAVETAHRAGLLHRDIKPANILVNSFGMPALTDFGIAATVADAAAEGEEESGLSVPWSAPEVLRTGRTSTVRSDVFSLAATLYTLLTGRTPFEVRGGRNTVTDLMRRIETERPQPLARDDVPVALERLLMRGLARTPHQRPATALAFASALRAIETDLGLPRTPMVVMQATDEPEDDPTGAPATTAPSEPAHALVAPDPQPEAVAEADGVEHTRLRVLPEHTVTVQAARDLAATPRPEAADVAGETVVRRPAGGASERRFLPPAARAEPRTHSDVGPVPHGGDATRLRGRTVELTDGSRHRHVEEDDEPAHAASGTSRRALVLTLIGILVVVGGVGAAAMNSALHRRSAATSSQAGGAEPVVPALPDRPGPVAAVTVTRITGGKLLVRWTNPSGQAGDVYRYWRSDGGADHQVAVSTRPSITLPAPPAGKVACVSVQVVRNSQQSSAVEACR